MERTSFTSATFSTSVFHPSCPYLLRWIVGRSDNGLTVNESTACLWSDSTSIISWCVPGSRSVQTSQKGGPAVKSPPWFSRTFSLCALLETGTSYETTAHPRRVSEHFYSWFWLDRNFCAQSDAENSHSKNKWPFNIPSPISAPSCSKMYLITPNFRSRNLHSHFTLKKYSASQSNETFFALVFP